MNAGDIARLVDVGRAAVSNWRRRHPDFPAPVGGTASSPLFSLAEVEDWLRRNGKPFQVSLADRVWQRLRGSADDLDLGLQVVRSGNFLLGLSPAGHAEPGGLAAGGLADTELRGLLADLAAERGASAAFEFLCARYAEVHARRLSVTPPGTAALMAAVAAPRAGATVLDPACGLGTLLLATDARQAFAQDSNGALAAIAGVRLLLRGVRTEVVGADSLRHSAFGGVGGVGGDSADPAGNGAGVDAVLCDPPFNERAWGYDELTSDPRWEYGLPPRGEPELAWVQHCLANVRQGGTVAILMPPAAAGRRAGRRIRGNLLRAGALRAVVTLADGGPDLWVLRRPGPDGEQPSRVLLTEAGLDLSTVEDELRRHLAGAEVDRLVRIIDILDDDVDCTPARYRPPVGVEDIGAELSLALQRFRSVRTPPPELHVPAEPRSLPTVTIAELVKAGMVGIRTAPARISADTGAVPMLTAEDLAAGREPSAVIADGPSLVRSEPGDVVAAPFGPARVLGRGGIALGAQLSAFTVDPARLDPDFLAGCLRAMTPRAHSLSSRLDLRRTRIPRLPLAEQREYGRAFRELIAFEDAARDAAGAAETLVRLGFDGLVDGRLGPAR